jgi:hypothetical protein
MTKLKLLLALMAVSFLMACNKSEDDGGDDTTNEIPEAFDALYGETDIYIDGNYIVIEAHGRPDHKSPYYDNTAWEATLYESFATGGGTGTFIQNPNSIGTQSYVFRIPLNPSPDATPDATALGPIGISINGVPFFNQYGSPNQALTSMEWDSFDQYNGHPDGTDRYHYHWEPNYLTDEVGRDGLLGWLLDGYPVYGPIENGSAVTGLDDYHGHTHETAEYPDGIYHYHITDSYPYINGNGYYGVKGTIAN